MHARAFPTQKIILERNYWKVLILGFPLALTNLKILKNYEKFAKICQKSQEICQKFVKILAHWKTTDRPCKRPLTRILRVS